MEITENRNPEQAYSQLLAQYEIMLEKQEALARKISWSRLIAFLLLVTITYLGFRLSLTPGISSFIVLATLFLFLVRWHLNVIRRRDHYARLIIINRQELEALKGDFSNFDGGDSYDTPGHPYAHDLDIFGEESLFRILNRTVTIGGGGTLAEWLKTPLPDGGGILDRQKAVRNLIGDLPWRQEFLALGMAQPENPGDTDILRRWMKEAPLFFGKPWVPIFLALVPVLVIVSTALTIFQVLNVTQFVFLLIIPLVVTGTRLKAINALHSKLGKKAGVLLKYAALFRHVQVREFHDHFLAQRHAVIAGAGLAIRRLARILESLDSRLNLLAGLILNIVLAWDIRQVYRLERWKAEHGPMFTDWFDALYEVDTVVSLSNFAYNHPESSFPVPSDQDALLVCKGAGHPIIPENSRVPNDIGVNAWSNFLVITGANMAGKSTYLRTAGINLVLAMAGSAVLAEEMRFRPVALIASIRTRDSLKSNESYFYAELKKLKFIIDALDAGPAFILLDEILKGTNSHDKQTGSRALVEQLIRLGGSGIIATHDLTLGELSSTFPEQVRNHCFEVQIDNDKLYFDYRLNDGVAKNLNASFLMRKMGITL